MTAESERGWMACQLVVEITVGVPKTMDTKLQPLKANWGFEKASRSLKESERHVRSSTARKGKKKACRHKLQQKARLRRCF